MRIKRGDTYPFQQCLQYDDKKPIDLTDATSIRFRTKLDGASEYKTDGECVIVDPINGIVQYSWDTSDTDTPGMYKMEYAINFPGGRTLTVPSNNTMWLLILGD